MSEQGLKGYALIALLPPLVWGSTYAVAGAALPVDSPILELELRLVPAAAVALLVPGLRRYGDLGKIAVLALLNFTLAYYGLFVAIRYLPGGTAAVLIACQPIVTMVLLRGFYKQRLETRKWTAGFTGLAGVAMVVSANVHSGELIGVLGALGCVLSQALGVVLIDRWSDDFDARATLAWQLLVGALLGLPFALLVAPPLHLTWQLGVAVGYVSVLGTTFSALIWYRTITRMSPSRSSLLLLLIPVVALLLDSLTGAHENTSTQWLGALVVLVSVLLGTRRSAVDRGEPTARGSEGSRRSRADTRL